MTTIYLDADCKCHATDTGGLTPVETEFFDGKCAAVIAGYRYVPAGETWTRADGVTFTGEMIAPWRDSRELEAMQAGYEAAMAEIAEVLNE